MRARDRPSATLLGMQVGLKHGQDYNFLRWGNLCRILSQAHLERAV